MTRHAPGSCTALERMLDGDRGAAAEHRCRVSGCAGG